MSEVEVEVHAAEPEEAVVVQVKEEDVVASGADTDDDEEDSSSSEDDDERITLEDGLSAETLQALMEFQLLGVGGQGEQEEWSGFEGGTADDAHHRPLEAAEASSAKAARPAPLCVSYTAKDSMVIAQTMQRLQEKQQQMRKQHLERTSSTSMSSSSSLPRDLVLPDLCDVQSLVDPAAISRRSSDDDSFVDTNVQLWLTTLEHDGLVRIDGVLSAELCNECLAAVNQALEHEDGNGSSSAYGFGNVFSRQCRYDMYLHPLRNPLYATVLRQLLHHHDSPLGRLFQQLLLVENSSSNNCYFHEFSCLVSDPGSSHQPLHPDAPYTTLTPLWTVFVALQDVDATMGPTVLVPTSHKYASGGELARDVNLSNPNSYRLSTLRKGDCIVMDARTYHMGAGNDSPRRRALLYCTLRNPRHGAKDEDFPPEGSLFDDLRGIMKLSDYDGTSGAGPPA